MSTCTQSFAQISANTDIFANFSLFVDVIDAQLKGVSSAPHKVDSGEVDGVKLFHKILAAPIIIKYWLVCRLIIK